MVNRNVVKVDVPGNYYQLRAEGMGDQSIFTNDEDYQFFLTLLERYVLVNDSVEVLAYCLAPNHFCLLLHQTNNGNIARLMHNIVAAYNRYFYTKHRVKHLLSESEYKVSKVLTDDLLDTSRHIHLEPSDWMDCQYSSVRAYFYDDVPSWINKKRIAEIYGSAEKYLEFLKAF